ncbi:MAG: methylmalonyl Co-A mutase-associated GTPase MeaB, partial [Actinobacteria bacterium]|nr:methylmalonyl Co-A mutase-associated GTPase MeaB [Actinomycetota bacterium]
MPTRSEDPIQLFAAAVGGDRGSLARLLSFVERGGNEAREVSRLVSPSVGRAYV